MTVQCVVVVVVVYIMLLFLTPVMFGNNILTAVRLLYVQQHTAGKSLPAQLPQILKVWNTPGTPGSPGTPGTP